MAIIAGEKTCDFCGESFLWECSYYDGALFDNRNLSRSNAEFIDYYDDNEKKRRLRSNCLICKKENIIYYNFD